MLKTRRRLSTALAASTLMAASMVGAPAPAQTGGDYDGPRPGDPCNPVVGGYYGPLECCYFAGQGWVYYININGGGYCGGIYQRSPETSDDRPAGDPEEPAGR